VESLIGLGKAGREGSARRTQRKNPAPRSGHFVNPTILDDVPATSEITDTKSSAPF